MKIAFISVYAGIIEGGVERHTHRIAKELAKKNEVTIFTVDKHKGKTYKNKTVDKVKYVRLPVSLDLSYRLKVWPALYKELLKGYDIIQGFGHGHLYFSKVIKAAKKTKAKLFYTIYGPVEKESNYSNLERIFIKVLLSGNDRKVVECDKIFLRNPVFAKEWLMELGVSSRKIVVDVGAIDKKYLGQKKVKEKENTILYNGRIDPQKGLQYLIDAMKEVISHEPKAQLVVTGPDQDGFERQMKEKVRKMGLVKNVKFLGKVTEEKLVKLFDQATVFVLPSTYEGLGQSLIKAMARGKGCIAFNTGSIPWVLDNGKCGVIVNDAGDFSDKIIELLRYKKKRASLGKKAKQRAKIFTHEQTLKKIIKEYK